MAGLCDKRGGVEGLIDQIVLQMRKERQAAAHAFEKQRATEREFIKRCQKKIEQMRIENDAFAINGERDHG